MNGLTIRGVAESSKSVTLRGPQGSATTAKVRGEFVVELALDPTDGGSLHADGGARPVSAGGDPRSVGRLRHRDHRTARNDLARRAAGSRFRRVDAQSDLARWVQSLIDVTNAREMRDDERFLAVRGPHSARLDAWLRDHVADYDVVLAHGVPFSTSVLGARHARQQSVPCVVLPHFHMDDKYYHWREFYEAFRSADRVIAAPRPAKRLFFDRIGARAVTLPGGGVDPAEFENAASGGRAFRALHPSGDPFVLVLGRKSGAKNYASSRRRGRSGQPRRNATGSRHDRSRRRRPASRQPSRAFPRQPAPSGGSRRARALPLPRDDERERELRHRRGRGLMCGRPVVANGRNVAFADLIEHGRNGLLCQTVDDVAAALKRLGRILPHEAARLGAAAGRAEALAGYTWPSIANAINDVLLRAVCRIGRSLRAAEETDVRGPASLPA